MNIARTILLTASVVVAALSTGTTARAQATNYAELFRTNVIKCVHPTVNPAKAKVTILKTSPVVDYVTTMRVKATYEGIVKTNTMEADFMIRQSGSIRQMKVKVLADSSPGILGCSIEKDWKDF